MSSTATDPALAASTARSILSCPAGVELAVDGVPHPLADEDRLGFSDCGGVPTFLCAADGALAYAALVGRNVLLTLHSAAGDTGWDTLALAGSLRSTGREVCACCAEVRERVVVDVSFVLLTRAEADGTTTRCRVPLAEFRSPAHQLNAGYLQRAAEHAGTCHHEELRRAVATRTGTPLAEVLGARLAALTPTSARLEWVDTDGGHAATIFFPRTARSADELGELLRRQLHPGIC